MDKENENDNLKILGIMSGTSCDGLDMALCEFKNESDGFFYSIYEAETFPYPQEWREKLKKSHQHTGRHLIQLDNEYSAFIAQSILKFNKKHKTSADIIASHGHTVYHQPEKGITFQLGCGAGIYAGTGIPVISDFRRADVALGGQGAPLVPVGDKFLFSDYNFCLNLGGIANISYDKDKKRVAYDVCPLNIVLNHFAGQLGKEYDENGEIARSGEVNEDLLKKLNKLSYYKQKPPKSLGREWIEEEVLPLVQSSYAHPKDALATLTMHAVHVISRLSNNAQGSSKKSILCTGGGTHNTYFMELLEERSIDTTFVKPDPMLIDYKEALIFAFLGFLRYTGQQNIWSGVTGCKHDHIGGSIFG